MIVKDPREGELVEDKKKIQESILFLLSISAPLTPWEILKALWFGDEDHLKRHGRPVTFDNYVAMKLGPVASLSYEALKPRYQYRKRFGEERPWQISERPKWLGNAITPQREPDLDYLSMTDRESLRRGLKIVLDTPKDKLEKRLHANPAYVEAWEKRGGRDSQPMKLASIIGDGGEELAEDLAYVSAHA